MAPSISFCSLSWDEFCSAALDNYWRSDECRPLPIFGTDEKPNKHAGVRDWQKKTREEALAHCAATPSTALFLPTSLTMLVVDVDTHLSPAKLQKEIDGATWMADFHAATGICLKSYPTVQTRSQSGGWHFYFRAPEGAVKAVNCARVVVGKMVDGVHKQYAVDLRTIGGGIVMPGSVLANGKTYYPEPGFGPTEVAIGSIPAELLSLLNTSTVKKDKVSHKAKSMVIPTPDTSGVDPSAGMISG